MHVDKGDKNTVKDTERHGGYTCCASCPNNNNDSNSVFLVPEYGLAVNMDTKVAWMFFGSEVVHGTTRPRHLDKSNFKRNDTDFVKAQKVKLNFDNVNVAWGVYNRAPPQAIYNRNMQRLKKKPKGRQLRKIRAGIRNFENRERKTRLQNRNRNRQQNTI